MKIIKSISRLFKESNCGNCKHYLPMNDQLYQWNTGETHACYNPPKKCGEWECKSKDEYCKKHEYKD